MSTTTRQLPDNLRMPADRVPPEIQAIYDQVGGRRAMAMAFSGWSYSAADTSATFVIAEPLRRQVKDRITHVRITLDRASDTYLVELLSVSKAFPGGREVAALNGAYAPDLRRFVESRTGLLLSMGTMGAAVAP